MCEPAHSIVQYPDHDIDDDAPFGGQMTMKQRLDAALGKAMSWGKKMGRWFHFSKLGTGHSGAILQSSRSSLILPEHTRYEGIWWERDFVLDGLYHGFSDDKFVAHDLAKTYHEEVVMSSMSKFRQFFEISINKSDYAAGYVERFLSNVLNVDGRNLVHQRLKRIFGKASDVHRLFGFRSNPEQKSKAVKVIMKYTRKRELFLPHWADDDRLWTPG